MQQEFDFGHPARTTDPDTSHMAADALDFRNKHFKVILYVLDKPMGKDGIARLSGLTGAQVDRRLCEMAKVGLVELTGKKVLSDSGRQEREWRKK
jgi:predicted Rossmann fold nucleotide-binding protein DprA/Smf involved in DNA uptake